MKRKIRGINKVIGKIDSKGARRFDNVYKDMGHVKKDCERSISHAENVYRYDSGSDKNIK